MKLRDVAALALMGWYPIVPPVSSPSPDTPLSQSRVVKEYSDKEECEIQVVANQDYAKQEPNGQDWARNPRTFVQCIATNDPRLKEPEK